MRLALLWIHDFNNRSRILKAFNYGNLAPWHEDINKRLKARRNQLQWLII